MASTDCFRFVGLLGLACLTVSIGCGKSGKKQDATVQGTVTIDGELATRGTIAFHQVDGGPAAYGSIHENGTFALRIGQGNPRDPDHSLIYSGDYVAAVVVRALSTPDEELGASAPPKPGVQLSAAKYSNKATSGLKFTIKPGLNVIDIPVEGIASEEVLDIEGDEPADEQQPGAEDGEATEAETPPDSQESEEPTETDQPADSAEDDASPESQNGPSAEIPTSEESDDTDTSVEESEP